jgi:putative endonuclease
MATKDELGRRGELLAAAHLENRGFDVIDRNWRCRQGEIDLVARDGNEYVFVEVKTRSSTAFGTPLDAITPQKLARLQRLAVAWCASHLRTRQLIRIDAIGIIAPRGGPIVIDHLERVG